MEERVCVILSDDYKLLVGRLLRASGGRRIRRTFYSVFDTSAQSVFTFRNFMIQRSLMLSDKSRYLIKFADGEIEYLNSYFNIITPDWSAQCRTQDGTLEFSTPRLHISINNEYIMLKTTNPVMLLSSQRKKLMCKYKMRNINNGDFVECITEIINAFSIEFQSLGICEKRIGYKCPINGGYVAADLWDTSFLEYDNLFFRYLKRRGVFMNSSTRNRIREAADKLKAAAIVNDFDFEQLLELSIKKMNH